MSAWNFNPRAPYGARPALFPILARSLLFQSTCPVQGTTKVRSMRKCRDFNFNPRAPYGARRTRRDSRRHRRDFNPRAPYGARQAGGRVVVGQQVFQSTCPVRGTTVLCLLHTLRPHISIHVPRTGHDRHEDWTDGNTSISIHVPRTGHDPQTAGIGPLVDISIHVPRTGHDLHGVCTRPPAADISIHVPRTGHDVEPRRVLRVVVISIHVPRTGHDVSARAIFSMWVYFNPRAPYGARPYRALCARDGSDISIHVPRTGHDAHGSMTTSPGSVFQSTCPVRGTTAKMHK